MTLLFDMDQVLIFALLLARSAGLVASAPLVGDRSVPRKVKTLFSLVLALLMTMIASSQAVPDVQNLPQLGLLVVAELSVGFAIGFVARLILLAFEFAGQIIGIQMGLGMAQVLDPVSGSNSSVVARWMGIVGTVLFLTLNGHHHILRFLAGTLEVLPPGTGLLSAGVVQELVKFSGETFVQGMTIAAPAIGVLLLTSMGLGILARTVPQMNVFIVGFPLKIGVGMLALVVTLPYLLEVARREVAQLADRLATLVLAA